MHCTDQLAKDCSEDGEPPYQPQVPAPKGRPQLSAPRTVQVGKDCTGQDGRSIQVAGKASQAEPIIPSNHGSVSEDAPSMADLFCGPTAPLAQAFAFCGWKVLAVDYLLDPKLDFSDAAFQAQVDALLWNP